MTGPPTGPTGPTAPTAPTGPLRGLLQQAQDDPAGLDDAGYAQLLGADGDGLEALCALADDVRAGALGARAGALTFVVNRNLTTAVVAAGTPESAALRDELVDEAAALGATELCVQGPLPPDAPAQGYLDLVAALAARAPGLHLHAFRPAEVADAATRSGRTPRAWLAAARAAGLGSVPGTGARILDDGLRPLLAPGGPGRPELTVAQWVELVTTAHEEGLRSTATIVYGHLESPAQQVAHLRLLRAVQERTGGFTELVPMPWVPSLTAPLPDPLPAGGRRGPSARETRALHAVARLLLHGSIDHVQVAWTKLGGTGGLVEQVLRGGADDLGGLLLDGAVMPDAGAEAGRQLARADVEALAARLGRTPRQRTTTYGDVTRAPRP